MEVMEMIHGVDRQPEDVDTGDICRDLTTVLTRRPPDEFDALLGSASGVRQGVAVSGDGTAASVH